MSVFVLLCPEKLSTHVMGLLISFRLLSFASILKRTVSFFMGFSFLGCLQTVQNLLSMIVPCPDT